MTPQTHRPLVSVLINNHNYERYVGLAIESALAQTWRPLEVIVVDDGSTDASRAVIASFGTRVRIIVQPNGGQGAAYNAGFAASRGEWVLFLDADDVLDDDALAQMMALAGPAIAKVQGYLRRIGPRGQTLPGRVPYLAHDGDVTAIARRFRQYGGPPASGNLYRRDAIARYLPMPEPPWRRSADTVPILLSVFHGHVATVPREIGSYRIHSAANQRAGVFGNINRSLADALQQADDRRAMVAQWGSRRAGIEWPAESLSLPWDWRARVLSWRLERECHPYPGDSAVSIWRGAGRSLAAWPGYNALERGVQRAWIATMLLAPRALVSRLAPSNVAGGVRERMHRWRGAAGASPAVRGEPR